MSINLVRRNDGSASVPAGIAKTRAVREHLPASVPQADMAGRGWVIAVLDDLRQFAQCAGMNHTARALAQARDAASDEIACTKC